MSYGIRNTLILLLVALLITGAGWGYIRFFVDKDLPSVESTLVKKKKQLKQMESMLSGLDTLQKQLNRNRNRLETYPKSLYPSGDQSVIYGFLNRIREGQQGLNLDMVARNTTVPAKQSFGVLTTDVHGTGTFRGLYRFVATLERSRPLNKITALDLQGLTDLHQLGQIDIRMQLESYYQADPAPDTGESRLIITGQKVHLRSAPSTSGHVIMELRKGMKVQQLNLLKNWVKVRFNNQDGWISALYATHSRVESVLQVRSPDRTISRNPFYPLIHAVPPNSSGKIDVTRSTLIGVAKDQVFLLDQKKSFRTLAPGDSVYLGILQSISQKNHSATFLLNRGGLIRKKRLFMEKSQ